MAEVILTCGLICTGKTTYAHRLQKEKKAALLSVDEITLALFPDDVGDMHDTYVERAEKYLFEKALELTETGINTVMDIGLWTRRERDEAREFFRSKGVKCEIHYIAVPQEEWLRRIQKRNTAVQSGECSAYYVDEGLAKKCLGLFQPPEEDEEGIIAVSSEGIW